MDPITAVGAVASVVQLASAALQLSKTLYSLGSAVGSANDDLHDLADDLKIFSQSLTLLSRLLEDNKAWYSDDIYILTAKIIKDCAELYVKIDKILAKLGGNGKSNWKMRVKFVYKEGQIRKLLKRLRDMKGTLATILMSLQVDLQLSLLNISSSSKIQRQPERPLQPETLEMLKDAQKVVDTNEVVSRYTSQSEPQSSEKVLEISSTQIDQETRPSMFNSFVVLPTVAKNSTVYSSEALPSFGTMSGKSSVVFQRRQVTHSNVDRTPNHHTESNLDISIRRSISVDSFKSAVSTQDVKSDIMEKIDAVQEVLHAFRTALETLENLIGKRDLKQDEKLYTTSQDLKVSLEKGERDIETFYKSRYEIDGHAYCHMFGLLHNKEKLQEITSEVFRDIVLVLHMKSAGHVVIYRDELDSLHQLSESFRQRAIRVLHSVPRIDLSSEAILANEKRARSAGNTSICTMPDPEFEKRLLVILKREGVELRAFNERVAKYMADLRELEDKRCVSEPNENATKRSLRRQRLNDGARSKVLAELIEERKAFSATTQEQRTASANDSSRSDHESSPENPHSSGPSGISNTISWKALSGGMGTKGSKFSWFDPRKTVQEKLNISASDDLIDLDVADPETIKNLKVGDRAAPKIPGSSPPRSPTAEAKIDLGLKRNPDSAPGNTDLSGAPEMTLPYIGYTFKRFEQTTRAGDPSSTIMPESEPTIDQSCREATAIYHFQPESGSTELIMKRGQNIWIDLSIPYSNGWCFATDEWKRCGWVPASYIRFSESIAIKDGNSTPISAQSNTTHHDISKLPQGQKTLREGLWWNAYLILHTDNQSKEFLSLNRALSYEFGTLTSKFISDKLIRERISILISRADSASYEFSPVFAQATEMRKHRAMVINILKTIDKSPFGFNVAMLGWCCVTVFLALYDPLFTNKSTPSPNLTALETQTLTTTFEQLKEITSIIARYAVKENIFSQKGNMTLEPEYKDALIDLAVTIFRWFGNAFEVWRRFGPGQAKGDGSEEFCGRLVEEIYRKEEACARFRIVCGVEGGDDEGDGEGEEISESESEESDGDWEKVTDELTEEGVILDERLDEKKLAVLVTNF